MSGFDLARQVRERYPDTRVILTSGYSAELMNVSDVSQLDLQVLRKPYRQSELARALRAALGDRSRQPASAR
jgi:DNA-binding NtrC family response regulator